MDPDDDWPPGRKGDVPDLDDSFGVLGEVQIHGCGTGLPWRLNLNRPQSAIQAGQLESPVRCRSDEGCGGSKVDDAAASDCLLDPDLGSGHGSASVEDAAHCGDGAAPCGGGGGCTGGGGLVRTVGLDLSVELAE